MGKKRVVRYSNEFRRMCVERLKQSDNIVELAKELDIHRRLLYRWRDELDPVVKSEWPPPQNTRESTLGKEVGRLKRVLADKTLEVDFFKGALQRIEARRQQSGALGYQPPAEFEQQLESTATNAGATMSFFRHGEDPLVRRLCDAQIQ